MTSRTWTGHYFDGKTSERQQVVVHPSDRALLITFEDGRQIPWPYDYIRQTQGAYKGESVCLEYGDEPAQVLVLSDSDFLIVLHEIAPAFTTHFHNPLHRGVRAYLTYVAALAVLVIVWVFYLQGIPDLASVITPWVPVTWEMYLGKKVIEDHAPPAKRCTDSVLEETMNKLVATLMGQTQSPYPIRVIVVRAPTMYALSASGGFIVVSSGLLEGSETPGQFASVLAHELQHILKRHNTQQIIELGTTGFFMAVISGEFSGMMASGLEWARTIERFVYSHQLEEEADAEGIDMLQRAGINPNEMIALFHIMKEKSPGLSGVFAYFSKHPLPEDRIRKLRSRSEVSSIKTGTALSDIDWHHVRSICGRSHPSTGSDH
ncbi:MAG: M48 family metallopeptidase [Nitrospira sp.]